jgi:hypothetical protein
MTELLQQVHLFDAALPLLRRHVCNLNTACITKQFAGAASRQANHCVKRTATASLRGLHCNRLVYTCFGAINM